MYWNHIIDCLANDSSATMRGGYGPIAPPPSQTGHSFSHANPFASLKIGEGEEEMMTKSPPVDVVVLRDLLKTPIRK
jgi:hypothetical protein